jgi:hypothetical protein
VFRSRLRLVPLLVALAAVAVTFGAMALIGAPLTMASIAVLPVLLGLGVDYAIQYQARVEEEGDPVRAARLAVPTIATAAVRPRWASSCSSSRPSDGARLRRAAGGRHRVRLLLALTAGTAALVISAGRVARRGGRAVPARRGRARRRGERATGRPARRPARSAGRSCAWRCAGRGGCSPSGWRSP